MDPAATVVIASKDRPRRLRRCLGALAGQRTRWPFDVVVVDDGSTPTLSEEPGIAALAERVDATWANFRVVRGAGAGPARARNLGIAQARGAVVLFTDDDTIPSADWVDAAISWLVAHPTAVGVEGPTCTAPYDPLYEHSVDAPGGGGLTCNIAYRRDLLVRLGGFYELFPYAHGEDLDLAYRALEVGAIGFAQAMAVEHPAATVSLKTLIREGRYAATQLEVARRHPQRYAGGWSSSLELQLLVGPARRGLTYVRSRRLSAAALARLVLVVSGQTVLGAWALLRARTEAGARGRSPG